MVICQMEVVIHFDHFYRMLVRCEPLSPEYAIMKRAELIPDSADGLIESSVFAAGWRRR